MVRLLRSNERLHITRDKQESWHSFFAQDPPAVLADSFGFLIGFDEFRLSPGARTDPHVDDGAELITYIYKGALSQEDSAGNSGVIYAGEFQRMSAGRVRHQETSVSSSGWLHMFRISFKPSQVGLELDHEQIRFTVAQRRNVLCVIASPDRRKGSLRLHQDALVFSAILAPGLHLIHALDSGHSAWLYVVHGQVQLNDIVLMQGDSVGIQNGPSVSLTVLVHTELLLVELAAVSPSP